MPKTELEYRIEGETLMLRKHIRAEKGTQLIERIKGSAAASLTTDEIMEMTGANDMEG